MSFGHEGWNLWRRQSLAVMRLEMKRTFTLKRGAWVYLLAAAPVVVFGLRSAYLKAHGLSSNPGEDVEVFASVYQLFFLRLAVFFGCAGIFMNLFRGEMLDKSLHYYFLAPVRREVLLAGKYFAAASLTAIIFCSSVILQLAALEWGVRSTAGEYLHSSHSMAAAAVYVGVTALACASYGGVFLAIGVLFRRALIPALAVLIWEMINSLLPPVLQKISVIYYLKALCPVQIPAITLRHDSLLTLISFNPGAASTAVGILSLVLLTAIVLTLAAVRLRQTEIDYGAE